MWVWLLAALIVLSGAGMAGARSGTESDRFNAAFGAMRAELAAMHCPIEDIACLNRELKLRHDLDQFSRRGIFTLCSAMPVEEISECRNQIFRDFIIPIDQENLERITRVIDHHGYPDGAPWTPAAETAVWFIIQHMPQNAGRDLMGEILPKVKSSFDKGRLSGWHYAAMFDRHELYQGREQYYGTQFRCEDHKIAPSPTRDAESVDDRRAALGMETVAEKAATFGPC